MIEKFKHRSFLTWTIMTDVRTTTRTETVVQRARNVTSEPSNDQSSGHSINI